MMMVQLQALFQNSDNCLLAVTGNGTNPKYGVVMGMAPSY